jgi:hypothetical protein
MAQQQPAAGPGSYRAKDDPQTESHDQAITQTFERKIQKRNESINGRITVSVASHLYIANNAQHKLYLFIESPPQSFLEILDRLDQLPSGPFSSSFYTITSAFGTHTHRTCWVIYCRLIF